MVHEPDLHLNTSRYRYELWIHDGWPIHVDVGIPTRRRNRSPGPDTSGPAGPWRFATSYHYTVPDVASPRDHVQHHTRQHPHRRESSDP